MFRTFISPNYYFWEGSLIYLQKEGWETEESTFRVPRFHGDHELVPYFRPKRLNSRPGFDFKEVILVVFIVAQKVKNPNWPKELYIHQEFSSKCHKLMS